jgi:polysaccharide biosynthesis transport protein
MVVKTHDRVECIMDEKQRQQISTILDVFLRRKKIIIASLLLALSGGIAAYAYAPKTYQATALLIYQQQRVNPTGMSPDQQKGFGDLQGAISKLITNRDSLEEMITSFNLYHDLRLERGMASAVKAMRQAIEIAPENKGESFRIYFEARDPEQAMKVANALAARFIEENLRFREEWTTENLSYAEDELLKAKKTVDEKEAIMRDYTMQHYNEMPGQRADNMARLNALQAQYRHLQGSIHNAERTRVLIQEQIVFREQLVARAAAEGGEKTLLLNSDTPSLTNARQQLAALQAKYTNQHPDVIRSKAYIAELEKSMAQLPQEVEGQSVSTNEDPQLKGLVLQLKENEMSINSLKEELEQTSAQLATYQQWIAAAPVREAEWASLTRDYNEFKKYYEGMVARSLHAGSAETLEKQQRGSRFHLVDAAQLPDKPLRPDFLRYILGALLVGLGLGGGLSYLIESLDTSFKDAGDLEAYLGIPVTCSIPLVYNEKEKRTIKLKANLWTAALAVALVGIAGGVAFLWYKQIIIV